jgi:DNA primase
MGGKFAFHASFLSRTKQAVASDTGFGTGSNLAAREAELPVLVAKEGKVLANLTKPESALEKVGDFHQVAFGSREYRIGGLEKNNGLEVLKITLRVSCEGLMHVDSLDLYRDGERRKFIDRAAEETTLEKDLLKRDLGKLLLILEQAQEQRLNSATPSDEVRPMTMEERTAALELLRSPDLLERITTNYAAAGVVGEKTNLLAAYLAATSRKLKRPLAIIIQSTSAAGKSTLMDTVLSFFPDEQQVKYSAMTGQSLYYLGESNLKHKILAIVEEEGAEKASYALKLLQSEGELTIASTGKDPHSGRMETQEYHVEGPVMIILTTTAIDIDEELINRCLILTVDESTAQTKRIHTLQREARTIEGILASEQRKDIQRLMQNAQRLIAPMRIANPFARHLTFTTGRTRTRRDHEKYLTLIDTIALLHQHQREPIKHQIGDREIEMLPVTLEDIEAANRIAPEVLGRSLDELPPQTRRLLESIKQLIRAKMKAEKAEQRISLFSRKELREKTGWSETQTRLHLERLEAMEYVHRRSGKQGSLCRYELLTAAEEPEGSWHVGLIDIAKLRKKKSA